MRGRFPLNPLRQHRDGPRSEAFDSPRRRRRGPASALLRRRIQPRLPEGRGTPPARLQRLLEEDLKREETANSLTHALGFLLALAAAAVLMYFAIQRGDPWRLAGSAIYAAPLVAVYGFSTLSHVFRGPRPRRLFRMLDQGAIYLLVAGTFTPLALAYLRHGWWWVLLAVVWGVALCGAFGKFVLAHRVDAVSTIVYLAIGWLSVLSAPVLLRTMPPHGPMLMLVGGLLYTSGIAFLSLDERYRFFHAAWHVMVIGGSACHYAAILLCVLQ